jgi:hypothetical protein
MGGKSQSEFALISVSELAEKLGVSKSDIIVEILYLTGQGLLETGQLSVYRSPTKEEAENSERWANVRTQLLNTAEAVEHVPLRIKTNAALLSALRADENDLLSIQLHSLRLFGSPGFVRWRAEERKANSSQTIAEALKRRIASRQAAHTIKLLNEAMLHGTSLRDESVDTPAEIQPPPKNSLSNWSTTFEPSPDFAEIKIDEKRVILSSSNRRAIIKELHRRALESDHFHTQESILEAAGVHGGKVSDSFRTCKEDYELLVEKSSEKSTLLRLNVFG